MTKTELGDANCLNINTNSTEPNLKYCESKSMREVKAQRNTCTSLSAVLVKRSLKKLDGHNLKNKFKLNIHCWDADQQNPT
ncbi:hypothetical protein T4E_8118 [Trichinella pseudospiralis]|uniref:Uncharacterized protein n=1 Tax=Trichinella pseudospiralis TaxID=6337 RepID=A0A0V0XM92_TRIPS|nr:hypothetical protein T4E_8118 [Trichinella pseudospiralis]